MQYRLLGNSGLRVSVLGLGTTGWEAHPEFGEVDGEGAARQVRMALDAGIDLFDTADTYGGGRCEEMLGRARGAPLPTGTRRIRGWPDPPIYDEEKLWRTIDLLVEIADARGCGVPQVALAYLLQKPGVVSLIIGARTDEQLAENVPAAHLTLETDEMSRLDDVSAPPLLYPYWWQAKYDDRLSHADLALLGRYKTVPISDGGLHRPLPGFDVIPGRS